MTLSSTSNGDLLLLARRGRDKEKEKADAMIVKHQPETPVKDQPESVSWITRNSVKDQVTPERQASAGVRQV